MIENEKPYIVVEVAKLYYQMDLSQKEIAEKLGISRPSVSRYLKLAKQSGVVKIEVFDPIDYCSSLKEQFQQHFNLKECIITMAPVNDSEVIKEVISESVAQYVHDIVKDGDTIGVTWGTTLYRIASKMTSKHVQNVRVVQLNGGISFSADTYAFEIASLVSAAFHTTPYYVPVPAIVDHTLVKQAIISDKHIKKVLEIGREANIAIVTTGTHHSNSVLMKAGYLSPDEMKALDQTKAVGDICARYINRDGQICSTDLDERTIGIELDVLAKKETSILAAGGREKVDVMLGALRGRYVNVLVTDQFTAQAMLDQLNT
ncbi:sugar-binding transcriptional regulator [Paenibacillus sp. SC116]|uniref:sugar-binding transcriptional regulator n=1 Tax=Paenibacillus sp. SC116 TaxID=2968986 RepID=UPI00215B5343|nr:sugar-binding transcriptional regulator [Paenibacillus sp. SC116]MCR8843287.1 sugar-binding transcriptional regulator [Paenibacillus sp. SC116]